MKPMWQVGLWRRSVDGRIRPIASEVEADLLMLVLTGEAQQIEEVDAEQGVWLTTLPETQADWLTTNGYLRIERDHFWLDAETP